MDALGFAVLALGLLATLQLIVTWRLVGRMRDLEHAQWRLRFKVRYLESLATGQAVDDEPLIRIEP